MVLPEPLPIYSENSHHPGIMQGLTSLLIVMGAYASSIWQERLFAGIVIVLMTNYKYNPPPQDV